MLPPPGPLPAPGCGAELPGWDCVGPGGLSSAPVLPSAPPGGDNLPWAVFLLARREQELGTPKHQ